MWRKKYVISDISISRCYHTDDINSPKKNTLNVNPPKRRCNKLANFLQCENLSRGAQTATLQNST